MGFPTSCHKRAEPRAGLLKNVVRTRRVLDNAHMESWNKSLKCDIYNRDASAPMAPCEVAVHIHVDFYDLHRLHSAPRLSLSRGV
jgi:putative transposase